MERCLYSAALLVALVGVGACDSEDTEFSDTGATGGSGGSGGQSGASGDGGAPNPDSLEDPEMVREWANIASAVGVYVTVYEYFAVADGQHTYPDPTCPVVTDDGTMLQITGGCADDSGDMWVGSATIVRTSDSDRQLTLEGFGAPARHSTGEASRVRIDDTRHEFSVNIVQEANTITSYDYSGELIGDYDTRSIWTGSGTVTREGEMRPLGRIEAATTDEVLDEVCSGQPASGNTSLEDEFGNTVVITYDGSVDCDEDASASYTLNGEPQGEITGIVCSVPHGGRQGRPFVAFAVLLIAAVLGVRRRLIPVLSPRPRQPELRNLPNQRPPRHAE